MQAAAPLTEAMASLSVEPRNLKEGFLEKIGEKVKNWNQRWCVVAGPTMCYYKSVTVRWTCGA